MSQYVWDHIKACLNSTELHGMSIGCINNVQEKSMVEDSDGMSIGIDDKNIG